MYRLINLEAPEASTVDPKLSDLHISRCSELHFNEIHGNFDNGGSLVSQIHTGVALVPSISDV